MESCATRPSATTRSARHVTQPRISAKRSGGEGPEVHRRQAREKVGPTKSNLRVPDGGRRPPGATAFVSTSLKAPEKSDSSVCEKCWRPTTSIRVASVDWRLPPARGGRRLHLRPQYHDARLHQGSLRWRRLPPLLSSQSMDAGLARGPSGHQRPGRPPPSRAERRSTRVNSSLQSALAAGIRPRLRQPVSRCRRQPTPHALQCRVIQNAYHRLSFAQGSP